MSDSEGDSFLVGGKVMKAKATLRRQRLQPVGVVIEAEGFEARLQPALKTLLHAGDEGENRLAPEGAIGLAVICKGVVAGKPQQQGRHAEGERDLSCGAGFRLGEVHVLRRERQRLPVEPAFEQQRAARVVGAREILFELLLEPRELFVGQMGVVGSGVDQRAGGPGGIVEQRLVPEARGVVRVESDLGGGERREAVTVIEWVRKAGSAVCLARVGGIARLAARRAMDELDLPAASLACAKPIPVWSAWRHVFIFIVEHQKVLSPESLVKQVREFRVVGRAIVSDAPRDEEAALGCEAKGLVVAPQFREWRASGGHPEILHDLSVSRLDFGYFFPGLVYG